MSISTVTVEDGYQTLTVEEIEDVFAEADIDLSDDEDDE